MKPNETKILIVEDEALIALGTKLLLTKKGFNVLKPVANGIDAIEATSKHNPDIILMDMMLEGDMNGVETAKKILSFCNTNIIFLTGCIDDDIIVTIKNLKPAGLFIKPVSLSDLMSAIQKVLDRNI